MKPARPGRARAGAFTLVELLAVVAVIGIVIAAGGTLLYQAGTVRHRVDAADRLAAEADAALQALAGALRNTVRPRDRDDTDTFFVGSDETLDGRPADRLRFFTYSHRPVRPGQPESDVHEVEFSLETDGLSPLPYLRRRTDPTQDRPPDDGGVVDRVALGVVSMSVEYFDGLSWRAEWPQAEPALPTAVRVAVAVMDPDGGPVADQPVTVRAYSRLIGLPHLPTLRDSDVPAPPSEEEPEA